MANKPDKFGIKFWNLVDVETKYLLNSFPYLGKDSDRVAGMLQGEYVVKKLMEPYINLGHCVCTDNFFTSFTLAVDLLKKNTHFFGTIKSNKRELPSAVQSKQKLYDSLVYEHDTGVLLTIYQCKVDRNVSILSTFHDIVFVDPEEYFMIKRKPNTITDYNQAKVGVDTVDQMTKIYTVKSPTRRWPMQVFYNLLNIAIINSWILYKIVNKSSITRRDFLIKLIDEIKKKFVENKPIELIGTPKNIRKRVNSNSNQENVSPKRVACQIKLCNNNKASDCCSKCKKAVCGNCSNEKSIVCKLCK
jgi:hypothetical protein